MTTDIDHPTDTETADAIVVGGGLAGLAAAATAARAGCRVVVLEGHDLGGRARVDRRNGFLFNRGPRALYLGGPGQRTLHDLDVPTDGTTPPTRGGMAVRGGQMHLLPQGPGSLVRTKLLPRGEKTTFGRRLAMLSPLDPSRFAGQSAEEAVASFELGPVAAELALALIRLATYTAATDLLDAPAAIAQLQAAAGAGVVYMDGGWQTLVDGLAARARDAGADIRTGDAARSVDDDGTGLTVSTSTGTRIHAASVVLAMGGPDAVSELLGARPADWEALGPPTTAACLELGLRKAPATRFAIGVDEPVYLSTHCPPADLAPEGGAVVHVMRYQRHDEEQSSDVTRMELRDLAARAGVADEDVVEERFLARMGVTGAIPTAPGGLAGRQPVVLAGRPGVLLAGDWVGDEGLLADAALSSGTAAGRLATVSRLNWRGYEGWEQPTMSNAATLDDAFEAERARLVGVAYRITGSRNDADDIVQDAWIRWNAADHDGIVKPAAWLTTVTSRIALDRLQSAQHRRETYVGPWLPEVASVAPGPDQTAELAESLTLGFLTMLERLAPVERVVFLLADVFAVPYDEIADVVDKAPAACRQIASRARRRVQQDRPRFHPTDDEAWQVARAFLVAASEGDIEAVTALLTPDAVETSDGGPDHRAGRHPIVGPHRVARLIVNLAKRATDAGMVVRAQAINGQPGVIISDGDSIHTALAMSIVDGKVDRIWAVVNPDKTATADLPPLA